MAEITSKEAYEKWYDTFMDIPEDQVMYSTAPIEVTAAEGRELAEAATQDREMLLTWGLAPELIDTLWERINAYTYAAAKYQTTIEGDPLVKAQWKEQSPRGYEVQKELTRIMTFAYRKDKVLSKRMDEIRRGHGNKDMIMDIMALAVLATDYPEPLKALPGFDFALVDEAERLHSSLGKLFARASVDPKLVESTRITMNRAFTFYKMAASEVMDTGRFAFEGTDRYNNYVSEYRQQLGKKAAKRAAANAAEAEMDDMSSAEAM